MSKRPISPLSLDIPKGQGAVPEVISPVPTATPLPLVPTPTAPASVPRTAMTYRPTIATHEKLRLLSFNTRRSMQELVDEAVEVWLERQIDR
jgi:hypothetical protein